MVQVLWRLRERPLKNLDRQLSQLQACLQASANPCDDRRDDLDENACAIELERVLARLVSAGPSSSLRDSRRNSRVRLLHVIGEPGLIAINQ